MADTNDKVTVLDIPSWAIWALEYGIEDDLFLTDEEEDMIIKFLESNFPNGSIITVDWNSRNELNPNPAFGKPCATYKVTFNAL